MPGPVLSLRMTPGTALGLRAQGSGWVMRGSFRVRVRFDPHVDVRRYEYRQYIRGTATIQQGAFPPGQTPTMQNWRATGPVRNVARSFSIPGGLPRSWGEDGLITGGRTLRFGYRSARAHSSAGSEDRYLPDQATGAEYRSQDTYGLSGDTRVFGLRIRLYLAWQGRIIDTRRRNRVIKRETWHVRGDNIVT